MVPGSWKSEMHHERADPCCLKKEVETSHKLKFKAIEPIEVYRSISINNISKYVEIY